MTMNKRTWVLLLSALVAGLMISPAWNWAGPVEEPPRLAVRPVISGPIVQYRLGGHDYLWVNPQLAGKLPPRGDSGPKGTGSTSAMTSSDPLPRVGTTTSSGLAHPMPLRDAGVHRP